MNPEQFIEYLMSFTSPERIMAFGALVTAVYAARGGSRRDRAKAALSVADMEQKLRAAIYEDLEKQREENIVLRRQVSALRARVMELQMELHSQPGFKVPRYKPPIDDTSL